MVHQAYFFSTRDPFWEAVEVYDLASAGPSNGLYPALEVELEDKELVVPSSVLCLYIE